LTEAAKRKLRVYEMGCLRQIKGITKRDRVRNEDKKAELNIGLDVVQKIQRKRLRYFGHVTRMEPTRYPNLALYGRVHGTRKRGQPKKRWLNNIEDDCKDMGLNMVEATRLAASDRDGWRNSILKMPKRGQLSPWQ
jgi:hypothetical protein